MSQISDETRARRKVAYESAADPRPERQASPGEKAKGESKKDHLRQIIGLFVGVAGAFLMYFLIMPGDVAHETRLTASVAVLMAAWWMTQAIPLPVTALIPLALFPILGRGEDQQASEVMSAIGASYGNPIIFLFLGGFMLALAMQRWNLHKRMALLVIRAIGTKPTSMVGGFMVATALISMWVSNTATAVMMLPIGMSVLVLISRAGGLTTEKPGDGEAVAGRPAGDAEGAEPDADAPVISDEMKGVAKTRFGTALMLGIAYAASIGSLGTIISTPPNVLFAAHMREVHGVNISFGSWMLVGVPMGAIFLFLAWFLLAKVLFRPEIKDIPGGDEMINQELAKLGHMSSGEKRVLAIFILAAASWILVPLIFPG